MKIELLSKLLSKNEFGTVYWIYIAFVVIMTTSFPLSLCCYDYIRARFKSPQRIDEIMCEATDKKEIIVTIFVKKEKRT